MDRGQLNRLQEIARELAELAQRQPQAAPAAPPDFFQALASIHQASDSQLVASTLARLAMSAAEAERAFVMLISEEMRLRFAAGENVTAAELAGGDTPVNRRLIQQALLSGEIMAERFEGRSVICAPVIAGSNGDAEKLGLLYVDQGEPYGAAVNTATLELIRALTLHGATALANLVKAPSANGNGAPSPDSDSDSTKMLAEKISEIDRLRDNLAKITEIGREISSTLDLQPLLIKIVDTVIELTGAQRGFIMLVEEGDEPVYKIGRNFLKMTLGAEQFKFSRSVAHKTITEKKPQFLMSSTDEGFEPTRSIMAMDLKSVLCVPLMEGESVLGLIYLDSQQSAKEFDKSDADLLQSLCGQAAVALINAKLYYQMTERERIQSELDLASQIQLELLPKADPEVEGLEIRGRMIAAKEVGGDYYDFIPHGDSTKSMTIAIGDVSGKGVGAGLVSIMARCIIRSAVFQEGVPRSTADIMRNLNTHFCEDLRAGMFMTLNICNWWSETNTISYTGAGHEHIIIYRAQNGECEYFKAGGIALGVMRDANNRYEERDFVLAEGDLVLLYSDGVTEAMNDQWEEWGLKRLMDAVSRYGDRTPLDLINAICQEIKEFRGQADQHDDITLVAMKARPRLSFGDADEVAKNLFDMFGD